MKRVIFLCACLLAVIPCQAKTITVEAPQPAGVTIEADDFNDATDISTAFADITLSRGGTGHKWHPSPSGHQTDCGLSPIARY